MTSFFAGVNHPVFLAGDFNGRPDGPVVQRLGLDWLVLPKSGSPNTYPSPAPDREIDFIMARRTVDLEVLEHRVVDEPLASDHRPILAVIRLAVPSTPSDAPRSPTAPGYGIRTSGVR